MNSVIRKSNGANSGITMLWPTTVEIDTIYVHMLSRVCVLWSVPLYPHIVPFGSPPRCPLDSQVVNQWISIQDPLVTPFVISTDIFPLNYCSECGIRFINCVNYNQNGFHSNQQMRHYFFSIIIAKHCQQIFTNNHTIFSNRFVVILRPTMEMMTKILNRSSNQ